MSLAELIFLAGVKKQTAQEMAILFMGEDWSNECHCCEDYVCVPCRIKEKYGIGETK
jgi:hypothetical protein